MSVASHANPQTTKPKPGHEDLHEAICRRAEEIYVRSGRIPGRDLENWMQAEKEMQDEKAKHSGRRTAIVVSVNGVRYVGEYSMESAGGYQPGEFTVDEPLRVRFEGEKMFVKRPNGKELETRIVKKIGSGAV